MAQGAEGEPRRTPRIRIDAHHHVWHYDPAAYAWIDESMAAIRRDFLPEDLAPILAAAGVDGAVTVQARQTVEETDWLLGLADRHAWIRGVVGWVPLADPDGEQVLARVAAHPKCKGVRHVLQGEPAAYMERSDFHQGVAALGRYGLVYDILIHEAQLPAAIAFVDRHPDQPFVLDHIAKPKIRAGALEPWAARMRELAERECVACKLSGLVTEADDGAWTPEQLRPYMETALEAFGPARLLFGSDWPVCLVACDYARWIGMVEDFVSSLSADEQAAMFGGNAVEVYGL